MASDQALAFKFPPVVETVIGVQMQPIEGWTTAHAAWFWREHLSEHFVTPSEHAPIRDMFEKFGPFASRLVPTAGGISFEAVPNRLWVQTESGDRLVQLQQTRFLINWRKRSSEYPSYGLLIEEFEEYFGKYTTFLDQAKLGRPSLNQWEITYVDHIDIGPDSERSAPASWAGIARALGSPLEGVGSELPMDGLNLGWSFEIGPELGRLHITVRLGMNRVTSSEKEVLIFNFTARGPISAAVDHRVGLEAGHDAINRAFAAFMTESIQESWGKQ